MAVIEKIETTINRFLPHQEGGLEGSHSSLYNGAIYCLTVFTVIGIVVGVYGFIIGHEHAYGISREVPWGMMLGGYIFFVIISTGLCLVSSIGHIFGVETFLPIAKRSIFLSIVTLLSGFFVIGFEIESPWRMAIYNIITPNFSSNIWWMGTLYGAFLVFVLIEFYLLLTGKYRAASIIGLIGIMAEVAANSNLGAVFGLLNGRDFWYGAFMPIYFIFSAFLSGCAAVIFFHWAGYKINGWTMSEKMVNALQAVGKLAALFYVIIMFFTTWKIIAALAGKVPGQYKTIMAMLEGPFANNFWYGEVILGLVLPLFIILAVRAKNITAMAIGSAISIIGIFVMRYDLLIIGFALPGFHDMGIVDMPGILPYAPTVNEWIVTLASFTLCGGLFMLGERLFRGHFFEDHH